MKAADIIGLYLDPPRQAAVFCIDEKTAIQALDRRDRQPVRHKTTLVEGFLDGDGGTVALPSGQ